MSTAEAVNIEHFFEITPRSEEGYLLISPHRKFHYDEQGYDQQYKVLPSDYAAGDGLFELTKRLDLDVNHPVLELGCGTGRLSVGLLKVFDPARLLVTDASAIFLDLCRRKFVENDLGLPHLGVMQFDDIRLLPDNSLSLIVLRSALHHVDKYEDFLVAASRKLVGRGAVIFEEPLHEGLFLLGLIAKSLQKLPCDEDIRNDLNVLAGAMAFYCRSDLDKSLAEDKHVFRLADILRAAKSASLELDYFPNKSFEDFSCAPNQFQYSSFAENYLKYCMSFSEKTVAWFMYNASDMLQYISEVAGTDRAPESSGVFVLSKTR